MSIMDSVEDVGKQAYQKQMWGAYDEAVVMYTNAIRRFPNDPRLFNNRCMCYIEMKDFPKALEDAENMTLVFPKNRKSYFRKGEVLMHLKKFNQAEAAFKEVLKLDPNCEDAINQITEAQIQQLSKKVKHKKKDIQRALRMTDSMENAEKLLKSGAFDKINEELENIVYYSDDEILERSETVKVEYDVLMDPTNPLGCTSLWVGNITKATSELALSEMFGRHGRIKSQKIMDGYAFVNYYDAAGPAKAMKHLQGSIVHGKNLIIKYPDSAAPSKKRKGK